MTDNSPNLRFACDAMLGGLARWLRAAGYDASWHPGIADRSLVLLAQTEQRVLLSSDTGIFARSLIRDGHIRALWIPHGLSKLKELAFVLRELRLPVCQPRCMACGGPLLEVPKDAVQDRVPPRSFQWCDQFWQCQDCRQVLWRGTHWRRVDAELQRAQAGQEPHEPPAKAAVS